MAGTVTFRYVADPCRSSRYRVLVDGQPIGEVWKRPARGFSREWRGSLDAGGRVVDGWTRQDAVALLVAEAERTVA